MKHRSRKIIIAIVLLLSLAAILFGARVLGNVPEFDTSFVWTTHEAPSSSPLSSVAYGNGMFVAVATNNDGDTPLMLACRNKHKYIAKFFLEQATDYVHVLNHHGRSALFYAVSNHDMPLVNILHAFKATIQPLFDNHEIWATGYPHHLTFPMLAKIVDAFGADINTKNPQGKTLLYLLAISYGDKLPAIQFVLDRGANPWIPNQHDILPFMVARNQAIKEIIRDAMREPERVHFLEKARQLTYIYKIMDEQHPHVYPTPNTRGSKRAKCIAIAPPIFKHRLQSAHPLPKVHLQDTPNAMWMLNDLPRPMRKDLDTQLGILWLLISDPKCFPSLTFTPLQQQAICQALSSLSPNPPLSPPSDKSREEEENDDFDDDFDDDVLPAVSVAAPSTPRPPRRPRLGHMWCRRYPWPFSRGNGRPCEARTGPPSHLIYQETKKSEAPLPDAHGLFWFLLFFPVHSSVQPSVPCGWSTWLSL